MDNDWKPGDVCICIASYFPENIGKSVILEEYLPEGEEGINCRSAGGPDRYGIIPVWRVFCEAGWRIMTRSPRMWREADGGMAFTSETKEAVLTHLTVLPEALMKIGDGDVQQVKTTEKSKDLEMA